MNGHVARGNRRRMLAAATALTATAAAGGFASAARAEAQAQTGDQAVFDVPGENRIAPHLESLIESAGSGTTIKYAAYLFSHKGIADALLDAQRGGATVQIIVSGKAAGQADQQVTRVEKELAEDDDADSWLARCDAGHGGQLNSCQGTNAMHNKFLVMNNADGTAPVVSTGTANLLGTSGGSGRAAPSTGYFDSWYTDTGNDGLYDRYATYFADLAKMTANDDYYAEHGGPTTTENVRSYFFPRKSGYTMVEELEKADCTNGGAIRVGHYSLKRPDVVDALIDKAEQGCGTAIILKQIDRPSCEKLGALIHDKPELSLSLRLFRKTNPRYMHNKDVLVDAEYEGTRQKIVFTGSNNLNSLSENRNDENLLRITGNVQVFDAFHNNWEGIKQVTSDNTKGDVISSAGDCVDVT